MCVYRALSLSGFMFWGFELFWIYESTADPVGPLWGIWPGMQVINGFDPKRELKIRQGPMRRPKCMTRHPSGMVDRTNTKPTEANDSNGDQRTLHPQKVFSTLFYTLVNKDYLSTAASNQGPPKGLQRCVLKHKTLRSYIERQTNTRTDLVLPQIA